MSAVRLSLAIQHHPARAHLLPPLLDRLGGFELVSDPEPDGTPNTLRTYRECLRRTPEWATHRAILQDDAWPCEGFLEKAAAAIEERPEHIICFFTPGSAGGRGPVLRAAKTGDRWARVRLGSWVPTVATCFPVELAAAFLEFVSTPRAQRERGDDGPLTTFCRRNRLEVLATVPSLVEHADRVPSLIGRTAGAGRNRSRVAALYAGDPDPRK